MIELMKKLCALPGPSGCEDAVRAFVLKRVKPFADEIWTDAIGNVMVFRKGRKALDRPVAVCAHMDEVGVIIKKITEDGMLKFGFVGGVDPRVVIGRPVRFGDVPGVIGIKAVHLTTAAERRTMPKTKNLYIDIGATSRAAAEKLVSLGDYGVFDSAVVEFGDGLIKAKAIERPCRLRRSAPPARGRAARRHLVLLHRAGGNRPARRGEHGVRTRSGLCDGARGYDGGRPRRGRGR